MGDLSLNYIDEVVVEIPVRDKWKDLSLDELFKVKSALYNRITIAGSNQAYAKPLQQGINELDSLISMKINSRS